MKISFTNLISKKQWQSLIFVDMIRAYCIFIYEWWNNFVIGFFNRGRVFLNMTGDPWPVCRYIGYGGRHFNRARWDCFRSCRYLVKYFILTLFFASLTSKKSCRLCTHLHAQRSSKHKAVHPLEPLQLNTAAWAGASSAARRRAAPPPRPTR